MEGSAIIWFDDQETKVWIVGGRSEQDDFGMELKLQPQFSKEY